MQSFRSNILNPHYSGASGSGLVNLKALLVFCLLLSCSGSNRFIAPQPPPDDMQNIPLPQEREIYIITDGFDKQIVDKIGGLLDFSYQLRKLFGKPREAANVDAFDEVYNSSWFTNRNATKEMSIEEIARGADTGAGPDVSGTWLIVSAKNQGVTPGFVIVDSRGVGYVIKFDPPGYPELASGAEAVSTKLFYAAGYFTAENYITVFDPKNLVVGEDVEITDERGRERYMTEEDLQAILQRIQIGEDGKIRALASKFIVGEGIGPFRYKKTRKDDPNDLIPHEDRRELRGLRVMASWLNHFDTKANNSYDAWVTEGNVSFVKHYLLDFGSTLGSISRGPMPYHVGHENWVDPAAIFRKNLTLGLLVDDYEKFYEVKYPSIGFFTPVSFHPQKYKFIFPNPAFNSLTDRDGFWGAKLVMSFTDEQIEAAVTQGHYSDPDAAAYLVSVLKERRDIVGRYWYGRVNPIDNFEVIPESSGRQSIKFENLAVKNRLEGAQSSNYRYSIQFGDRELVTIRETGGETVIPLPDFQNNSGMYKAADAENPIIVAIQTQRNGGKWSKAVKVFLQPDSNGNSLTLLGIKR